MFENLSDEEKQSFEHAMHIFYGSEDSDFHNWNYIKKMTKIIFRMKSNDKTTKISDVNKLKEVNKEKKDDNQ